MPQEGRKRNQQDAPSEVPSAAAERDSICTTLKRVAATRARRALPPYAEFGGAQCVYRVEESPGAHWVASDHRKDGQAVGY